MAELTITSATPVVLTVEGEVNDAGEVVADLTPAAVTGEAGALLAANNLSDVEDPAAALTNLGAREIGTTLLTAEDADSARMALSVTGTVPLVMFLPDIISASAVVVSVPFPCDGAIVGADLWASATIAVGNLTATLDIDGIAVTNGVMTLTTGSTSGTIGACTPTANNDGVFRQSVIRVTVGGGNTAAGRGTVTVYVRPEVVV